MEICRADIADLANILELQKICYYENAVRINDFHIQPLDQTIKEITKEYKEQVFLKVIIDSKIVGSVRAFQNNDIGYIGKLIVHPDYQNKGIGSKLMNHIEKIFNNVEKFELFTGFKDEKNIYLYQKLGYEIFREQEINSNLKFVYMEKNNCSENI